VAVARKLAQELLQDNSEEEYSNFSGSEDDCHRNDVDIHPDYEDDWEVCDAGNHTSAAGGNTNSDVSDVWKQFVVNENDLPRIPYLVQN
jgi:hypothetical protein